jgi:hypothetical protein
MISESLGGKPKRGLQQSVKQVRPIEQAAEGIETASSRKFQTDNAMVQEVRIRRRVNDRGKNP